MIKKGFLVCAASLTFQLAAVETYAPFSYEEIAGSYEELALAYENLACQSRSGCGVFKVGAEYLYWHLFLDGTGYAIDGLGTAAEGTVYAIELGWASGYRLFAGYEFPSQNWLLSASWLDYHTNFSSTTAPTGGLTLFATISNPTSTTLFTTITGATGSLDFRYNSFSTDLSYNYRLRCGLVFTPILGVCFEYIKNDTDILYRQAAAPTTGLVMLTQSFNGIGPEIGLGTDWNFFRSISLYGRCLWKPLWSSVKTQFQYDVVQAALTNDVNVAREFDDMIQSAELAVGVKMNYPITRRMGVTFALGWETHYWFNADHNIYFLDANRQGTIAESQDDFSLSGLTARMVVTF